jgi:hypothetical protein
MTHQEVLWQGRCVIVASLCSKSGKLHRYVKRYIGLEGFVLGQAKNGMLLIQFSDKFGEREFIRAIPAGCVVDCTVPQARYVAG